MKSIVATKGEKYSWLLLNPFQFYGKIKFFVDFFSKSNVVFLKLKQNLQVGLTVLAIIKRLKLTKFMLIYRKGDSDDFNYLSTLNYVLVLSHALPK